MIKIEEIDYGDYQEIRGSVNHREVISITNQVDGKWGVSSSAILPWDMDKAGEILKCFQEAYGKVF